MKNASAIERINYYLVHGGLWNPEAMEHDKVRELLRDIRTELADMQERLTELEALPKEWEGSGYSPQQCARIVKLYQGLQKELAGYPEIGPCERGHLKMFWLPGPLSGGPYCQLCREIEQAVEREVAGAYEAAAQVVDEANRSGPYQAIGAASAIRSLDSSAAQRGKQRIREEALREAAQLIPCSCVQTICSQPGCGEIHKCIDPYCLHHKICELIDKPGGR